MVCKGTTQLPHTREAGAHHAPLTQDFDVVMPLRHATAAQNLFRAIDPNRLEKRFARLLVSPVPITLWQ